MRIVITVEHVLIAARQAALHTSAVGFGLDFSHALFGKAMILYSVWERTHELAVSWAAFAATIIVYIDTHRERVRVKKEVSHHE